MLYELFFLLLPMPTTIEVYIVTYADHVFVFIFKCNNFLPHHYLMKLTLEAGYFFEGFFNTVFQYDD